MSIDESMNSYKTELYCTNFDCSMVIKHRIDTQTLTDLWLQSINYLTFSH